MTQMEIQMLRISARVVWSLLGMTWRSARMMGNLAKYAG